MKLVVVVSSQVSVVKSELIDILLVHSSSLRCVSAIDGLVVEDLICDPANKPSNERPCRVACPGECVVSSWSTWTTCNQVNI